MECCSSWCSINKVWGFRKESLLTSTRKALIAAAVAVVFSLGLIVWQVKARRAEAVNLSSEDLAMMAEDQPPQFRASLAADEKARKDFAEDIKRLLAMAEAARAQGVDKTPEMKRQLRIMRAFVIAEGYLKTQGAAAKPDVSEQELEAVFQRPENKQLLDDLIADAKARNPQLANNPIPEEQLKLFRQQLGELLASEAKGIANGVESQREVQLQILFQQSRALAQAYARDHLANQVKATDAEIDAYVAQHPELDPAKTRAKAEDVLKRAQAGEDFGKLAAEFSTDPGSKDKGGDIGWMGPGDTVPEFENAALALKPGEISDIVESTFGYHIIKLEELRTEKNEGKSEEQFHARHILIGTGQQSDNPFAPPQSGRDQARAAVEREKQKKLLDDIVKKSRVTVAEDFQVKMPEASQAPALPQSAPEDEVHGQSDQPGAGQEKPKSQDSNKRGSGQRK